MLAGVKLAVLLSLDLRAPAPRQAGSPGALPAVAAPAPVQALAQPALQAGQMVRAAILEDSQAMAAQQAAAQTQGQKPAPAAQDKPKQQDASDSVLTIAQLKAKAEDLDRKEQALKSMESDLNARLAKLQELETTLTGMLADAKALKEEKMKHLIEVYTNMKPKQAGTVMETLDESIAVKILAGMKGRTAGDILNSVSAKKAAALTEDLTKLQVGPELPDKP